MGCMKCGRDLETEGQVFCEHCLEAMARVPVKPGTVIILPKRREEVRWVPVRRRGNVQTPEQKILRLKRRSRVLALFLSVMILVSLILGFLYYHSVTGEKKLLPGQNYSAMETTAEP